MQQVVNSLSVAGLATILTARATTHIMAAKAAFAAQHPRPAGAPTPPHSVVEQVAHALQALLNAACVAAFQDTFTFMVIAALIGAVMGLVLRRNLAAQRAASPRSDEDALSRPNLLAG